MSDTEPTEPKPKSKLLHYISTHPVAVCIMFLAAIATLTAWPFAAFPWIVSAQRELCYCINPIRTPIIRAEKKSEISITYKGLTVVGDVTAVQIAIWNAGREPIRSEDVLSPIVLSIPKDTLLFEVRVVETNRAVIAFRIDSFYTNSQSICMKMNWRILERADGALIQLIYAGRAEPRVGLEGTIVGQRSPHKKSKTPSPSRLIVMLGMATGASNLALFGIEFRSRKKDVKFNFAMLIWLIFGIASVAISLLGLWLLRITTTPFGF